MGKEGVIKIFFSTKPMFREVLSQSDGINKIGR